MTLLLCLDMLVIFSVDFTYSKTRIEILIIQKKKMLLIYSILRLPHSE